MRNGLSKKNFSFSYMIRLLVSSFFSFPPTAELPPGWEKIDDPVYGVYYVE